MASTKHKPPTPRENPIRIAPEPPGELATVCKELPTDGEQAVDRGSRVALAGWLLAFILLGGFALWDLIIALLFR
jgi:hypothetical protein